MDIRPPIKFAVVGHGNIGSRHAMHINEHSLASLVAIVDTDSNKWLSNIRCFHSLDDMDVKPDVINICTPNGLHEEHLMKALTIAPYVVVEKPVAIRDCQYLERYKDNIFCVMQNRFTPAARWLKTLDFGKIFYVQIDCFWNRNQDYYNESPWRGTKDLGGGTLFTQFSHFVDMLYWLFGVPEVVYSKTENLNHPYTDIDDQGHFDFELVNGSGTFNYSINCMNGNMESSITIIAEKGTVKVGGQYMQKIEHCQGFVKPELPQPHPNGYNGYQGSAANHYAVINNVVNTIMGKEKIAVPVTDEIKVVDLITKVYNNVLRKAEAAGY